MGCHGSYVKLEFNSADASSAAKVSLYDDQQDSVTLGANELLIIDSLNIRVGAAITVDVFADDDGDDTVDAGERLALVGQGSFVFEFPKEGLSCPTGVVPDVKASGAGAVTLVGTGRIINNRTETLDGEPTWRAAELGG
jgi:hypothetical protein